MSYLRYFFFLNKKGGPRGREPPERELKRTTGARQNQKMPRSPPSPYNDTVSQAGSVSRGGGGGTRGGTKTKRTKTTGSSPGGGFRWALFWSKRSKGGSGGKSTTSRKNAATTTIASSTSPDSRGMGGGGGGGDLGAGSEHSTTPRRRQQPPYGTPDRFMAGDGTYLPYPPTTLTTGTTTATSRDMLMMGGPASTIPPTGLTSVSANHHHHHQRRRGQPRTSWLCRSRYFRKLCDSAFDCIDADESGHVDETELYAGLLMIHLYLGMYLGPAACKPLDRERCRIIFRKMDADQSGSLDREEFRHVMMVLFGNVMVRVLVQWSLTIILVPMVASYLVNALVWCTQFLYECLCALEGSSYIIAGTDWFLRAVIWDQLLLRVLPGPLLFVISEVSDSSILSDTMLMETIPITLISVILGIVVVPWFIFRIDDFFQWLASWKTSSSSTSTISNMRSTNSNAMTLSRNTGTIPIGVSTKKQR